MAIRSARNHQHLIVNVSIQIPLKNKCPHPHLSTSLSPSPNHKKKYKLIPTPHHDKKTTHTSHFQTLKDLPYLHTDPPHPSRKKQTAPTPQPSARGLAVKVRSTQLSPRQRAMPSRRKQSSRIVRNISILQQVSDQQTIIKYTSASNELKQLAESIRAGVFGNAKMDTHVSEVDMVEIRNIETQFREGRDSQRSVRIKDILRTACAKKIQRAWRRYKTKRLIKSYSNDIRKKDAKRLELEEGVRSARSQGTAVKLKMRLPGEPGEEPVVQTERAEGKNSRMVAKFQEESIEKWEQMLCRIRNQKNIDKLLEISMERTEELKNQLGSSVVKEVKLAAELLKETNKPDRSKMGDGMKKVKEDFFEEEQTPNRQRIIKTKGYYEQEREKRRQASQRSIGSLKREERVNYFENQMLRIQNDLSDISADSIKVNSIDSDNVREMEELENIKLRKKLEIFKEHLPQILPFTPNIQPSASNNQTHPQSSNLNHNSRRIDIASIIKKKQQQSSNSSNSNSQQQLKKGESYQLSRAPQSLQFQSNQKLSIVEEVQQQMMGIQTHREWKPLMGMDEHESKNWKSKLGIIMKKRQEEMNSVMLEELVLQALIQISQSEKLIAFIKDIYEKSKKTLAKPEGIVTSHTSIKDYLNYFIKYFYQQNLQTQLQKNLLKPVGPSPYDVMKYFRGEDLPFDPESEYVMNIRIFNQHWKYANDLIYFDPKWQDERKQAERVSYLKQLTKVFFRAIFDCFNESLQFQRIYGLKGKPFPWSQQRLNCAIPNLRLAISESFQRVLRLSSVFCGVHFADKQHSLDQRIMDEIQEENMVKLIVVECKEEEELWNFFEDQLAEVRLELAEYVQNVLIMEAARVVFTTKC